MLLWCHLAFQNICSLFKFLFLLLFKNLQVAQVTAECGYYKNWVISIVGPSYPRLWLWIIKVFFNIGNLTHLKFANSFGHKVQSLFYLLIKKSEVKSWRKKIMGKQSRKVVQVTPIYCICFHLFHLALLRKF